VSPGADYTARRERFRRHVIVRFEREVLGSDYGADGYTTMAQATDLAERLPLGPGARLLDLGAGWGWPGVFLAERTGASVVSTDLPLAGLRSARARAGRGPAAQRAVQAVAHGARLPFPPAAFDVVTHADVLC
jgi:cyclopropane fatty-acyl-phospholipid synthase-like methyltransferase